MSDELYYTPSTLEERIARARARRAEEERAIVALEAKELEVAAEAERLRNKEPLEVMTKMLTTFQASLVEKLEKVVRKVDALSIRITDLEYSTLGPVTIAGIPYAIPAGVNVMYINHDPHGAVQPCTFDGNQFVAPTNKLWSLEGFQRFKRCHTLHLFVTDMVKDFTPLGGMTALQNLTITAMSNGSGGYQLHPQLSDIRWISSLVDLRQVSFLGCNLLKDITPLATLRNLQEVTLRGTRVHSTECIARLKVNTS